MGRSADGRVLGARAQEVPLCRWRPCGVSASEVTATSCHQTTKQSACRQAKDAAAKEAGERTAEVHGRHGCAVTGARLQKTHATNDQDGAAQHESGNEGHRATEQLPLGPSRRRGHRSTRDRGQRPQRTDDNEGHAGRRWTWERLAANVGIVLIFGAFYFRFRRS